ncbi:serine hydrolase [Tepidiforma sp.]|uniref:serine hydrolase n=1 Tax=Tepidiforma sp. TaxID=2682230 RepID=UPI002ADD6398|nr:serine hydrolase [Tepidiforma sp.]
MSAIAATVAIAYLVSVIVNLARLAPMQRVPPSEAMQGATPRGSGAPGASEPRSDAPPGLALESVIRSAVAADEAATTGVAVVLPDGSWIGGLNPELPGYAASTFKLALLYEAERRVSEGRLGYDDRLALDEEARREDLGTLARLPIAEDGTISLGQALEAMVVVSDNASAIAVLRLLGPSQVDARLRQLGIVTMSVNDRALPTTARDLALLMAAIVRGEGLNTTAHTHALDLLFAQEARAGIPAALEPYPDVIRVGNKTGTWDNATRDVAVVEAEAGTYVVAAMTEGDWNWELVGRLARAIHGELTRQ